MQARLVARGFRQRYAKWLHQGLRSQKRYSLNSSLIIDSEAIKIDPMIEMDYTQIARIILFYTTVLRVWGHGCVRDQNHHEGPTLPSAQPPQAVDAAISHTAARLCARAGCWSVALDTRREELVTLRGQAMQEHTRVRAWLSQEHLSRATAIFSA